MRANHRIWGAKSLVVVCVATIACAGTNTPGVYEPPDGFFDDPQLLIDFDRFPSGTWIPDQYNLRHEYGFWGVHFSVTGGPSSRFLKVPDAGGWGTDYISASNSLAAGHTSYATDNSAVTLVITFDTNTLRELPTRVGLVFTDSAPNNPFTVTAYSAQGAAVDAVTINTADYSWYSSDHAEDTFIGLSSAEGIQGVECTTEFMYGNGIWGFEIDNLQFSPFVLRSFNITNISSRCSNTVELHWQSVTHGVYSVYHSDTLTVADWTLPAPTDGWPITYTHWTNAMMPAVSNRFFRVRATSKY